jgi:hypothetical protein
MAAKGIKVFAVELAAGTKLAADFGLDEMNAALGQAGEFRGCAN